jgi:hypothetical protein
MIKVIADNPEEQDLADYLKAISQPYIRLVQQSAFDSMLDGRIRAVIVEVIGDEINYRIIFPEENNHGDE